MTRAQYLNSFDIARFVAATMVIFSHSFDLTGVAGPHIGNKSLGGLAVWIFFILSGFLIAFSWKQYPRFNVFMAKRALRIFPALAVVILLSILVLSFFSKLSHTDYFSNQLTWSYLNNIFLFNLSPSLPGVFENNIHPNGVNSPLWTLAYEFTMYISVALLGVSMLMKRGFIVRLWLALFTLNIVCLLKPGIAPYALFYLQLGSFIPLALMFFTGVLLQMYDKIIIYTVRRWIASLLVFTLGVTLVPALTPFISATFLAYGLVGFCKMNWFSNFGRYGDFSYGLYIYAFPIQQAICHLTQTRNSLKLFVLSFVITLGFAIASWALIESRFIKLKKRIRHEDYPVSEKRAELSHAW